MDECNAMHAYARPWETAPKDKEKHTDLELNDVFFLHDQEKDSSYWEKHTHSMQHLAVRIGSGEISEHG